MIEIVPSLENGMEATTINQNDERGERVGRVKTDIKINVDTTELDEAIEKANQLLEILKKISIVADSHLD